MKTIAFFNGFYLPHLGGVENYTYQISKKLIELGYRVVIVTSQHEDSLPFEEETGNEKIYRLPVRNICRDRFPLLKKNSIYMDLIKKIHNENINYFVINTWFYSISILGSQLASKVGKKALVIGHVSNWLTLNNILLDFVLHKIERMFINKIRKNTNIFYGVSNACSVWLKTFGINSNGILYNSVVSEEFERFSITKTKKNKKVVISFVGRLQAKFKGIEMLLSAFVLLSKEYENIELVVAGDGPIYQKLNQRYCQNNIVFLGQVSHEEVMKLNAQSDIFVLMSKVEGFSTALLEAGLLKNVIITTNVGGARELISNEKYGFVIENDEGILLDTLRNILENFDGAFKIKENVSRKVLDNFTWEKTVKKFIMALKVLEEE